MKELLNFLVAKNNLKFGDYCFSPITEASAGIALEYCKKVSKDNQALQPIFFCLPIKNASSLWTSIIILTNYFLEDYINNVVEGISFRKNEKVKIFNCIAKISRVTPDIIYLNFRDQDGIPINKKLQSQLSKVDLNRSLSLKKRYDENFKDAKNKRNAISKILVPNDSETINQNNLDSKVLLIAGRGNTIKFHELLNEIIIYDEPLSKIFPENKNLIISPDLKKYKDLFNLDKEKELIKFKDALKKLEELVELDVKSTLIELNIKLRKKESISLEFEAQFLSFLEEYKNKIPQLKFLETLYPGHQDSFPENLRALVINDISQIIDYPDTINGFLKKRIPVIIISNRNIDIIYDSDFYKRIFNNNPDYYRLNWNRKKIVALNVCSNEHSNYIDIELWLQCKRYSQQQINIHVSSKDELDTLSPIIYKHIRSLVGFENLQKAFWVYLYPALYALKNSIKTNNQVKDLIFEFKQVFDETMFNGISQEVIKDFERVILLASQFNENTKFYESDSDVFSNLLITSNHHKIVIPVEKKKVNIPTSITNSILFTGYPYNEYSGRYLLNSVCRDYVPDLSVLCWPNEASLTMNYLKKRIRSGYFSDNLFDTFPINNSYLLKDENDFENEISTFLNIDFSLQSEDIEQESDLDYIHTFKYHGYGIQNDGDAAFKVKCNILNFDDGSFMFLPKRSSVLAQAENSQGGKSIIETNFDDLSIGYKIFKYKKDRSTYREISKNDNKIKECFEKLEIWKEALENVYNSLDNNLDSLEKLLNQTKEKYNLIEGNPIKTSIQRWLFDDEIICPRPDNLIIILLAAKVEENENKLAELIKAYKEVSSYTIGLSANIKKNITKQFSSKTSTIDIFYVNINGNKIPVETRTIASLDKNEIEIDYRNTRKILC